MSTAVTDEQAKAFIAANVRELRGERSRNWLAREVGTYPINITRIESKENMPGAGLLTRLAEALGTTVDGLLSKPKKLSKKTG